jgi:hypothetical protein
MNELSVGTLHSNRCAVWRWIELQTRHSAIQPRPLSRIWARQPAILIFLSKQGGSRLNFCVAKAGAATLRLALVDRGAGDEALRVAREFGLEG